MSVLLLDRLMVHYEVLGRGRPVLFLHGWLGSWRYWIPAMQAVSISYRAYAIDLWGYGESSHDPGRYTPEQQMGLIDAFLDQMGIMKLVLIGHGWGALLALKFAASHPEVVDRVMAVSCPLEEAGVSPRLRVAQPAELADWLLSRSTQAEAVSAELSKIDLRANQAAFTSLSTFGLGGLPKEVKRPCLLVHGSNDPAIQFPRNGQIAELPYLGHSILFEQSGHFPMIDEDNRFHRLLIDFLALPSGDSPRDLQLKEEWKRRVR